MELFPAPIELCPAHNDLRANSNLLEQVGHILVQHTYASRRHGFADGFRLYRAMNPVKRVLATCVQIKRPRAQGIARPAWLSISPLPSALITCHHFLWRHPARPAPLHPDFSLARPGEAIPAHPHAVAHGLSILANEVKVMLRRIYNDSARSY